MQKSNLQALVIDDNEVNRMLAVEMLANHGITSDEAMEGRTALALLHEKKYDIVLLDISMPGLDGKTVCKYVREDLSIRNAYIVAYTAHAFPQQKKEFLEAGFNALLVKPVSMDAMATALGPLLARAPAEA